MPNCFRFLWPGGAGVHGGHGLHRWHLQSSQQQKQEQIHQHSGLYAAPIFTTCFFPPTCHLMVKTSPPLRRPQQSEALHQSGRRRKVWRLHQRQFRGREWLCLSRSGFVLQFHLRLSSVFSSGSPCRATREPGRTSLPKGPSGLAERTSGGWSGSRTSEWLSWSLTSKRKDG